MRFICTHIDTFTFQSPWISAAQVGHFTPPNNNIISIYSYVSSFKYNPKVHDTNIKSISFKPPKWGQRTPTKYKVQFAQVLCAHEDTCHQYHIRIPSTKREQYLQALRFEFTNKSEEDQRNYIRPFIHWKQSKNRAIAKRWKDGNNVRNYPKTYDITIPNYNGIGLISVCAQYFRWMYQFGCQHWYSYMGSIWNQREGLCRIQYKSNHKGRVAQFCHEEFVAWLKENYPLYRAHYQNSHQLRKLNKVYIDLVDGVEYTPFKLYKDWIQFKQPAAFAKYLKRHHSACCWHTWYLKHKHTIKSLTDGPRLPNPTFAHFKILTFGTLDLQCKRTGNDKCKGCTQFLLELSKAKTTEDKKQIEVLQKEHLLGAGWKYQWIEHKISITLQNPTQYAFYQVDYDIGYPEIETRDNINYYRGTVTVRSLNMIQLPEDIHGSRKIYMWPEMIAGKKTPQFAECLEDRFKSHRTGAKHAFIVTDSAEKRYELMNYLAFWCLPWNNNRYFESISLGTGEVGHTYMRVDGMSGQSRGLYKQKETFSNCSERAQYINDSSNIQVIQMTEFHQTPSLFKKIFIPQSKWIDLDGKHAHIRDDPGVDYDFGRSLVWDTDKKEYQWVDHWDELWIRHDYDFTTKFRKIKILKTDVIKQMKAHDFVDLQREPIPPPCLRQKKLTDTLDICDLFANKEELQEYYKLGHERIITDKFEKKLNQRKESEHVLIKMKRRIEMRRILSEGNSDISLTKYTQDIAQTSEKECTTECKWTTHDMDNTNTTCKDMRDELSKHGLKKGMSGLRKNQLRIRLKKHYKIHGI
eukprot:897384_1